ncbi:MAG: hypothetical protein M1113_01125 [Candidatus Thermoplasmatota archaeon]|nr:hypothetical protein [Candidatus Thermoplasmatota archaeon]
MNDDMKRLLSLGLFLASILIILNAAISFIFGVIVGSLSVGIIDLSSHPISLSFAILFIVFALIGGFIGYTMFRIAEGLRNDPKNVNWTFLIVLSVVAFIFDSGYFIGALIGVLVGLFGYIEHNNLFHFPSFGFNTIGTRICPKCGFVNSGNAKYCSSCGEKFPE